MTRLTKPDGTYCRDVCGQDGTCSRLERGDPCTDAELYARLQAYEDTGLEPEEIADLAMSKAGRPQARPLAVGDIVYTPNDILHYCPICWVVKKILMDETGLRYEAHAKGEWMRFNGSAMGWTVFATRLEAVKAALGREATP